MIAAVLGALFFGLAAFAGTQLGRHAAERLERFDDGPPAGRPPVPALVAGGAAIGAFAAWHATAPPHMALLAAVVAALAAAWCTDALTGMVPDWFTLAPLALVAAAAMWQQAWWPLIGTLVPVAPFALLATISRGRGMGWADVKLVALGGALLGMQISLVAFALACAVAVAVHALDGKRGAAIAFAPYLAAAIAFGIPAGLLQ